MAKKSAALTGPVITLLDLVVQVPVNCGSVCADAKEVSTAPAASDDRSDRIMGYGRWKVSRKNLGTSYFIHTYLVRVREGAYLSKWM